MKLQNMKGLYEELQRRFSELETASKVPRQVFVAKEVAVEQPAVPARVVAQIEQAFALRDSLVRPRTDYLIFKILQQNAFISKQDKLLSKCRMGLKKT